MPPVLCCVLCVRTCLNARELRAADAGGCGSSRAVCWRCGLFESAFTDDRACALLRRCRCGVVCLRMSARCTVDEINKIRMQTRHDTRTRKYDDDEKEAQHVGL